MKHLTKTDLILFATKWQKIFENSEEKNKHIATCSHCKSQLVNITKILNSFSIQNEKQCNRYFDYLLKYMEKAEQPQLTPDLKNHLDNCEVCAKIYENSSLLSPLDYAMNLNFKLPKNIFEKVDLQIYAELEKLHIPTYLGKIADEIQTKIENNFRALKLSLIPVPALKGTRGEKEPKHFIFTHPGGNLQLQIGISNEDVKLFGIFEDKTFTSKTDLEGNVIFENLPKDDYRVEIEGHAVSDIKTIPLN